MKHPAEHLTIARAQAGSRIDNFLINFCKIPHSRIYQMIRKGEVRVNGGRIKPQHRLEIGQILRIPPFEQASPTQLDEAHQAKLSKCGMDLLSHIIYEDEGLLIINKPAGLASQGGTGIKLSVIDSLRALYPSLELAHRLDRETSGLLLLAKDKSTLRVLHKNWGEVRKFYVAVIKGQIRDTIKIDAAIVKQQGRFGERIVGLDSKYGKPSCTLVRTVKRWGGEYSMVIVRPLSGRMHQIRVHLSAIGCPIVNDNKYMPQSVANDDLKTESGMALQAWKLYLPQACNNFQFKANLNDNILRAKSLLEHIYPN